MSDTTSKSRGKALKKRSVVSSFIFRYPNGDPGSTPQVCLFRRSQKVRTYQGHLAAISGSIESDDKSPLDAAERELEEETSLRTPHDLEFLYHGKPFTFQDEDIGREWTVWPFAWRLKEEGKGERGIEEGVEKDFEHEGWKWINPNDVLNGSMEASIVPRLDWSLRRVYIGGGEGDMLGHAAGKILQKGLRSLKEDHDSGARELATKAVTVFRDVIGAMERTEDWQKRVKMAAWHIVKNGRESMGAAIGSAILDALAYLSPIITAVHEADEPIKASVEKLDLWLDNRKKSSGKLGESFAKFVGEQFSKSSSQTPGGIQTIKILTLSNSSALRIGLIEVLKQNCDVTLDLRIVESRPICEGAAMARILVEQAQEKGFKDRLHITLASDSSMAVLANGVDAVLFGADRVSEQSDVSNKMGSYAAVLCAKALNSKVKAIALCESEKIAKPGDKDEHKDEDNDPQELMKAWSMDGAIMKLGSLWDEVVDVKNVYFEWVPAESVDCIIVESGQLSREEIKQKSERIAKTEEAMFEGL